MIFDGMIPLAIREDVLAYGINEYCRWNFTRNPHMLITGASGSGKTYFLKLLLGRIAKYVPFAEMVICDFKGDSDFEFLNDCENFYRFDDCIFGLKQVLQVLRDRQSGKSTSRHPVFLVFDEWSAFLNSMDRKDSEEAKKSLATLLMLGRSFNIHCILSLQRADASNFSSARDNFSVICLFGKLSKESVVMLASDFKDSINRLKERGHGSIIIEDTLTEVLVPSVSDMDLLHVTIKSAVRRL